MVQESIRASAEAALMVRVTGPMTPFSDGVNSAGSAAMVPVGGVMSSTKLLLSADAGWNFDTSVIVSAAVVLAYVLLGGLTSAIYNEVLQFFMIVFGFAPLVWIGLRKVGGVHQFQIVQRAPDKVLLRVVPDRTWRADTALRMKQVVQQELGAAMGVDVEEKSFLERPVGGKLRVVVNELEERPRR